MTGIPGEHFFTLVDHGSSKLRGEEVLLGHFVGEESDFVRFNGARVRQAMTVRQGQVALSLVEGQRRETTTTALTGLLTEDRACVSSAVTAMRESLSSLPEDPYLLYSTTKSVSERKDRGRLPDPALAVEAIIRASGTSDLVGIYASGPIQRGFASSLGHRHFHEVDSFQLDFSVHLPGNRAVSRSYATSTFDETELSARIDEARRALELSKRPAKALEPGRYRAYLSPLAVSELVGMLNWGGVSSKAQRTRTSCLQKLCDGEAALSPKITLVENTAEGLAPAFDEVGFVKPERVRVIHGGRHAEAMVGPRTAKEYGIAANADAEEILRSPELAPGDLPASAALAALDTGVYVGNLWYLGFSDRPNARMTGMTRFATFWVEGGEIVAPLEATRFDDSLYRLLGEELVDLTVEREWISSVQTYSQRSVETSRLPGALIRHMTFTL